jgi:hypothetical protein
VNYNRQDLLLIVDVLVFNDKLHVVTHLCFHPCS